MSVMEIQTQPDFPRSDVLDQNAFALELSLQNGGILDRAHKTAEQASVLYEMTHIVIRNSGEQFSTDTDFRAVDYGVKLYEGLSALLEHEDEVRLYYTVQRITTVLGEALRSARAVSYYADARDMLAQENPVAHDLIKEVSRRHFPGREDYVLMGAGIERQAELEAMELEQAIKLLEMEKEFSANPGSDAIQ